MTEKTTKRGRPLKTEVGAADHLTEKKLFYTIYDGDEVTNLTELLRTTPAYTTMKAAKAEIQHSGGKIVPVTINAVVSGPIRTL